MVEQSEAKWTVFSRWGNVFQTVQVLRETQNYFYVPHPRKGERRIDKFKAVNWRGTEAEAVELAERLTSARAEMHRRIKAAEDWYADESARTIAGKI